MTSWLDHLPSQERAKIRKRLRSPEAYEALRNTVKGPEDLERELHRAEQLAEVHFALETTPGLQDALQAMARKDMAERGIDAVLEVDGLSPDGRHALEQGKFTLHIAAHPVSHEDALVAVAEGNVQEKIPVKPSFSDRYVAQCLATGEGG